MQAEKLAELKRWRDAQAKKESVEAYRILSNAMLEEIARAEIKAKEDLLSIKGIKDRRFEKYGEPIWEIVRTGKTGSDDRALEETILASETGEKIFSVSVYLDLVNVGLRTAAAKVQGEVSGLNVRGGHYYFDLKDKADGSVLSCFLWKNLYGMFGVELKDGLEIVIHGYPGVHKPNGRLSFRIDGLELVGEGILKQQYEKLKSKLEAEGLLAAGKKRALPFFPEKIGVITSRQGAVINDFLNNIGQFGFKIKFIDVRVEGAQAVPDILAALRTFKKEQLDVLVVMRGGGSLEALQAFNNEMIVREIASFPAPVVAGIGHDKDVPLAALAADISCSTPSIAAAMLTRPWAEALSRVELSEKRIVGSFGRWVLMVKNQIERSSGAIQEDFRRLLLVFSGLGYRLKEEFARLGQKLRGNKEEVRRLADLLPGVFRRSLSALSLYLDTAGQAVELSNPERQLRLGYGLVRHHGKILKRVRQVPPGEELAIQLQDGTIYSDVKRISIHDEQS